MRGFRLQGSADYAVLLLACLVLAACQSATPRSPAGSGAAQSLANTSAPNAAFLTPSAFAVPAPSAEPQGYSELVVDLNSGRELHAENADEPRYPASLTKMMTLYLLFDAVRSGRVSLDTPLVISPNAARQPPSKIGLRPGMTMTVQQAARALSVKSANDVAVAVAETVAGSEAAFVRQMNAKARALGMTRTRFVNPSGLPDTAQVTTARDMARLGQALIRHYPQYARYYQAKTFFYNGRTYRATNNLLGRVEGVNGLKTGYIRLSGYNLVATSDRAGRKRMVVVMGGKSEAARDREVTRLIETYY
ncbi:D-alanyl-D-alanine carboxypeptidase family protein [Roseibium sp. RKSG952]|uniref:D-alanyl-D-alanine carboxypeptidase family protein n=1 Tax=Roseibium sp. RKSG952 TaxID=2529384 RepID=UPI0012BC58EF|nr:D-alanyl-D-alanine carboxypeptidase family protein [Roseibium sp. RKSG952]MTH94840.1 D-alanyl-D-alanine carboxypeptidase [Roseibium sp. RKSG952]